VKDLTIQDYAAIATIAALLISMVSIAFSAWRYLNIRSQEMEKERFETFHNMLKLISKGRDDIGPLKLVSQIAYIHELNKYSEYKATSKQCLRMLRKEWAAKEPAETKKDLLQAIDEVLAELEK
jgi:hypothetical protein